MDKYYQYLIEVSPSTKTCSQYLQLIHTGVLIPNNHFKHFSLLSGSFCQRPRPEPKASACCKAGVGASGPRKHLVGPCPGISGSERLTKCSRLILKAIILYGPSMMIPNGSGQTTGSHPCFKGMSGTSKRTKRCFLRSCGCSTVVPPQQTITCSPLVVGAAKNGREPRANATLAERGRSLWSGWHHSPAPSLPACAANNDVQSWMGGGVGWLSCSVLDFDLPALVSEELTSPA